MTFPRRVREALEQTDHSSLPGAPATDRECEGAKFHSPSPLVLHSVEVAGETVHLCGTCRENMEVLRHLLVQNGGDLPWPVRREFGNRVRALAEKGWRMKGGSHE